MRVGILGGTGNISKSFLPLLLELGHEVTCINRGKLVAKEDLPKDVKHLQADRAETADFEKLMQQQKFEGVIDMICFNADQAASSIRAFAGPHLKHFIHCSTVCTYGVDYDYFPSGETHPLRPISDYGRNKVAADETFLKAHKDGGFPVTIIKPSTTYGPKMGALRQVVWEFGWIDRVRKGKPILVCGDGNALHQFLHVDDAALCFSHALGREKCIGQTYNMTKNDYTTWAQYHKTAMKVLGREVELVGVPFEDLKAMKLEAFGTCEAIFAHHVYYDSSKLMRDVPEFAPKISLEEGLTRVIEAMDKAGRIPNSDDLPWEDKIIEAQRKVRNVKIN